MQRFRKVFLLLFISVLLALPQLAAAGPVYRWVDENGAVHYGDLAPEGVEATRVDIQPNTVTVVRSEDSATQDAGVNGNDPEANDGKPELSYAEQRRQDRAARRLEIAETARKQQIECDIMRQQKNATQSGPRVLVDDGNGGVRRLDDDERGQLLTEANAFLAENCLP